MVIRVSWQYCMTGKKRRSRPMQTNSIPCVPTCGRVMSTRFMRSLPDHLKFVRSRVVIDRFHVTKGYHACADELRKKETRRLRKELPKEAHEQIKKTMWPFRKHLSKWDDEDTERMKHLFDHSPVLRQAYDLREKMTVIFEQQISRAEATLQIKAWETEVRNSGLIHF